MIKYLGLFVMLPVVVALTLFIVVNQFIFGGVYGS